jgi:Beta-propeller repeat
VKKRYLCLTALILAACSSAPNTEVKPDALEVPNTALTGTPDGAEANLSAMLAGDWTGQKFVYATPSVTYSDADSAADLSVNSNGRALLGFDEATYQVSPVGDVSNLYKAPRPVGSTPNQNSVSFRAVKTDAANSAYIVGNVKRSYFFQTNSAYVRKIVTLNGPSINLAWKAEIGATVAGQYGTVGATTGTGVGVDSSGNVYIGGSVCLDTVPAGTAPRFDGQALFGKCDQFVTKFSSLGVKQWSRILGSAQNEKPGKISVSAGGSVFVTGTTDGSLPGNAQSGGGDLYVAKYDTNGTRAWVKQFGSPQTDTGTDIAVDFGGSIYVSGWSDGALNGSPRYSTVTGGTTVVKARDGVILRLNANGVLQWTRRSSAGYSRPGGAGGPGAYTYTYINDLAVDGANNVYVVGQSLYKSQEIYDAYWPLKFSSSGNLIATGVRYQPNLTTISGSQRQLSVAVGPAGVYMTVRGSNGATGKTETYIVRHNFNLVLQ